MGDSEIESMRPFATVLEGIDRGFYTITDHSEPPEGKEK